MPTQESIEIGRRQSIPKHLRYTIDDFKRDFPNDDVCLEYLKEQRFPGGIAPCDSAKCKGQERKHHRVSGRTAYACDRCGKHIYPLVGTIFEKSATPLHIWFHAMFQMGSTRCGISAKQIQRETGVTYKTAWRMFRQIRSLLEETPAPLGGSVEIDEMYHGGRRKGNSGRPAVGDKHKLPVVGFVQRGGKAIILATADIQSATLLTMVREYVLPKSTVFTDELRNYSGISVLRDRTNQQSAGYIHRRINHSAKVYVVGDIHTNSVEGFWSLIKRGIGGVYHQVSQKYLQSYLNEYTFRYNVSVRLRPY